MHIPYNAFLGAFLNKITEYNLIQMNEQVMENTLLGYLSSALYQFDPVCKYDLTLRDDEIQELTADFADSDTDEIVDIVSEGMLVQWMKPYLYKQENLELVLNTKDFTTYSPAELLRQIGAAYTKAQKDYTNMIREYSYRHGDLTDLHL